MNFFNRKPSWLELKESERYVKSIMVRQVMFVVSICLAILGAFAMPMAIVLGDSEQVLTFFTVVLGAIAWLGALSAIKRLHLTTKRLVTEISGRYISEIGLDEIETIQIKKYVIGGKVVIIPTVSGDKPVEILVMKPNMLAEEIQAACANAASNNNKGEV